MPSFGDEEIKKLSQAIYRYKITAVFTSNIAGNLSVKVEEARARHNGLFWIADDDFQSVVDDLVFDDWTSGLAELYGLTNTELLSFRLSGEFPEDKRKPINPSI